MTDCKIAINDKIVCDALNEESDMIRSAAKLCKKKMYLFDDYVLGIVGSNIAKKYVSHDDHYFVSTEIKNIIEKNKIIVDKIVSALL
jgi:hypothetical protein